jgi:VanZ family protein
VGVILIATSIPGADLPRVDVRHIDKAVHLALYGVWGLLLGRAGAARLAGTRLAALMALVAAFAAADEWHQTFIPGRSADVRDWAADVTGGAVALLLLALTARPARPDPVS